MWTRGQIDAVFVAISRHELPIDVDRGLRDHADGKGSGRGGLSLRHRGGLDEHDHP